MIMRAVSSQQSPGALVSEARATQDSSGPLIGTLNHCVTCHSRQGFGKEGVGIHRLAVIPSLRRDEMSGGGLCSAFKTEKL